MCNSNAPTLLHIGEFGLIDIFASMTHRKKDLVKGIGDDAAVIKHTSNKLLLLTTDMLIEGVHFTKKMGAQAIGRKALACNLSDIAAMGGIPKWAVVSAGIPSSLSVAFAKQMFKGMNLLAKQFGVSIVGGDTVKHERIVISVALLGEVEQKKVVFRAGAQKGDSLFVTGRLGRSLKTKKHLFFTPRLKEARYLVEHFRPHAMIDISDGLAADLGHILKVSNVGAVIYEELIPRAKRATLKNALYDGENYELLVTLPAKEVRRLQQSKKFPFYRIGEITDQKKTLMLCDAKGQKKKINFKGFTHF